MITVNQILERNAEKRKILKLKKSKGFQKQQYYFLRGKYKEKYGISL